MILPIIVRRCLLGAVAERPFALAVSGMEGVEPLHGRGEIEPRGDLGGMRSCPDADRFESLPRCRVLGLDVPVAANFRSRLLGLAGLSREQAGAGLLIPRCASVHTFGMRFDLDLAFLDGRNRPLAVFVQVPPRRLLWQRGAVTVLEVPSSQGGEFAGART
jgi:uncharacterized protein